MVASPARGDVAFVEFNRVYVARLPVVTNVVDGPLPPPSVFGAVPARGTLEPHLVGLYGGDFLSWSADGRLLTWVHGPYFYELDVTAALRDCACLIRGRTALGGALADLMRARAVCA
jgi:hypothetical protein